jgi:predicted RNase H-like HicB family nuclease
MKVETSQPLILSVKVEEETDGRWLAGVEAIPGALAYGATEESARARVTALVLWVMSDRVEHGEAIPASLLATTTSVVIAVPVSPLPNEVQQAITGLILAAQDDARWPDEHERAPEKRVALVKAIRAFAASSPSAAPEKKL